MTLTDRLRRIEQRLDALEKGQAEQVEAVGTLVDALAADDADAAADDAPTMTLDGEQVGGARDQSQPL